MEKVVKLLRDVEKKLHFFFNWWLQPGLFKWIQADKGRKEGSVDAFLKWKESQ